MNGCLKICVKGDGNMFRKWISRLFCRHAYFHQIKTYYGSRMIVEACVKCGKEKVWVKR